MMNPAYSSPAKWVWRVALLCWLALVAAGMHLLNLHMTRASTVPESIDDKPRLLSRASDPGRFRLVMLVHPRCACTRASLAQLQHLLDEHDGSVQVDLLIYSPPHADEGSWGAYLFARRYPGLKRAAVRMLDDPEGAQARSLGLAISGHLIAFDSRGAVRFSGGLTALRGQAFSGDGFDSVSMLLSGGQPLVTVSPVFGCPIVTPKVSALDVFRKTAHADYTAHR